MATAPQLKALRNYRLFLRRNQNRHRKINDIVVEAHLVKQGLLGLSVKPTTDGSTKRRTTSLEIIGPSAKEKKTTKIRRTPEKVSEIIKNRVETKETLQSIVFAVSLTEDYINDVLIHVLRAYPKKLLISAKGNQPTGQQTKTVSLEALIEAKTAKRMFKEQAAQRARDALYAAPMQYVKYFNKVMGFDIPDDLFKKFAETKATRDLYVHGDGRINSIYLEKVGDLARGAEGELASLNNTYFEESIATMKQIFSVIYKGMLDKYGDCKRIERVMQPLE